LGGVCKVRPFISKINVPLRREKGKKEMLPRDVAGHVKGYIACASVNSGAPSLVTAAGTGDNTKVTGYTIDRKGTTNGTMAYSCELSIGYLAALTNAKTLSFAVEYQESSDNSSWATAVVLQAATVAETAGSSTNFEGVVNLSLDLSTLKRYVRFNITPDLSHSSTDTAEFVAIATLGGFASSEDAEG
jgi:hypothetical protein